VEFGERDDADRGLLVRTFLGGDQDRGVEEYRHYLFSPGIGELAPQCIEVSLERRVGRALP
jgi:hypothetical protein